MKIDRGCIGEDWTVKRIEDYLKIQLNDCEIVCDLNLCASERNTIKNALRKRLEFCTDYPSSIHCLKYHATLTLTDFIYFARHDFDHESIWEKWSETLGLHLNPNHQSELGKKFIEILEHYKFPVDADGGMKYISPILVQTGIPDVSLHKLFNAIDGARNDIYFDARSFINEMIGFRDYLVDRSVIRYFKFYQERAEETILQLNEMFNLLGDSPSQNDLLYVQSSGFDERIVEQYIKWRGEEKYNRRKNNKTEAYYQRPRLIYDVVKGISILLPKQNIRNQYINVVEWRVHTIDTRETNNVQAVVYQDVENYSESKILPVRPSASYDISLYDLDDITKPLTVSWKLELQFSSEILFFSAKGELIKNPSIPNDGLVVVYNTERVRIKEKINLQEFEGVYLHSTWVNYRAFKIFAVDKKAQLILDNKTESILIESRKDLEVELSDQYTILNTRKKYNPIPMYSRLPIMKLNCSEVMDDINSLSAIKIQMYHPLSNKKITCELNNKVCEVSHNSITVDLKKISCEMNEDYGKYEIKISYKDNRQILFFFLGPNVVFTEATVKLEDYFNHPDEEVNSLFYKSSEKYKLKFNSDINEKEDYKSGSTWYEIIMRNQSAFLEGEILIPFRDRFISMPFTKEIRPMEWSLYDISSINEENTKTKFGLTTLFPKKKGLEWRLVLRFAEKPIEKCLLISLENNDGKALQQIKVLLDPNGQYSLDLMVFSDTVLNSKLPLNIRLLLIDSSGYNTAIDLVILEEYLEFENFKYLSIKEKMYLVWQSKEKFENRILKISSLGTCEPIIREYNLTEFELLQFNNKGEKFHGIYINEPIENGIYSVEIKLNSETKSIFSKKRESYIRIEQSKLLLVKVKDLLDEFKQLDNKCNKKALKLLMCGIKSSKAADEISIALKENELTFENPLSLNYRALVDVVRAMAPEVDISNDAKEKIKPIISSIIVQNLKPTDRNNLMKYLLINKLSNNESIQIINELQLYCLIDGDFTHEMIKCASDIQPEIALLMILNNNFENCPMDIQRLISAVGLDLLMERVIFSNVDQEIEYDFAEQFKAVLNSSIETSCKSSLLEKDIMGSGKVFADFIARHYMEITKGKKLSVIQDDELEKEVEFFGSTYTKMLIHWFDSKIVTGKSFDLKEVQKAEHTLEKFRLYKPEYFKIAEERLVGVSDRIEHRAFRLSALISLLMTTDLRNELQSSELVMKFLKSFVIIFPKLAYRDMILACLSQKFVTR